MAKNVKANSRGKRKARKNIARGVAHVQIGRASCRERV